jgi:hypothetical protein
MRSTHLIFALLAACGDDHASTLDLPGTAYYPENLYAAPDGSLYVPSLGTGEVVRFAPGATTPTTFIAAAGSGADSPKGVSGIFIDGSGLWLCAVDLATTPPTTEVRQYDLATAAKLATYPFSQPAFCNDLVRDAASNLFVTDSFGAVWKLAPGASALAVWSSDPQLAPPTETGFGADGIAIDEGSLWVTNFSAGQLLQIPIAADGTAQTPIALTVTPRPSTPDGLRSLGGGSFVFADGATGTLTEVAVHGTTADATMLASGLNGPTSVAKIGATYWVSEGQIGHLTGALTGAPSTPFDVRAVVP